MHVISILSIIASIAAVLVSIFLYILAYRRDEKERYLPVIGWLNLIVGISMGIVVISTLITPISEGRLSSVFILAGVLIVSAFILVQVVFLISTRSFFRQQQDKRVPEQDKSQVFDVIASNSKEPGNLDELDRLFCEYVRSNFNKVPTILSEISPDVENIFVPTRAYDKPQIQKLIKDEGFTDPLDLLDEEYEQWLYRSENARDLLDILSRESRNYCVLLGEPGAGKTTFMKYLAWKVAATNTGNSVGNDQTTSSLKHLLPVYISLHEFATYPSASLFEFIVSYYNTIAKRDMNGKFGELFKHKLESGGKVLLLLDGLDEAYTGATRREAQKTYERVCRSISRFAQENNKAELHLLVTSRKASYKSGSQLTVNEGEEFKTLEMVGFLPEDVERFIQNEFNLQSMPREANNLIMLLQLDQRLREMSVNPLLLTFITMIFLRGGHVSANRSWLYEQCVDYYLQKWDRIRAVERFNDFSRELKDTLLEELAWKYHKERRYVFEEDDLRKELEHLLRIYGVIKGDGIIRNRADPLVDRVLHEIIANSGLLTNFSISSYGFTFFVFQEYFASRYALERVDIDEELGNSILRYWGDFWWEDAIFMLATQLSSTSVWLERLMNTRDDFFNTSTLLAGRTLADQRLPGTAPASQKQWDIIEKLFTRLNETRYRSMSDEIVKTLVEVASPVVNRRLLHVLIENSKNQESSIVNDSIIKYLGQWGNCIDPVDETYIDLIKELKESLKDSQENGQQYSISIRRVILHALEALEGSAIVDFIVDFLGVRDQDAGDQDSESQPRSYRVWTADEAALLREMVRVLKRLRAVEKIGNLCHLLTFPPLIQEKQASIDFLVEVARTLGVLGFLSQKGRDRDTLIETLMTIIEDSNKHPQLRIVCINALVRSRSYGMQVGSRLVRLLNNDGKLNWLARSMIQVAIVILEEQQPGLELLLRLLLQKKDQSEEPQLFSNQPLAGISRLLFDLLFVPAQQKQSVPTLGDRLSLLSFIEENRAYVFVLALVEMLYRTDIDVSIRIRIAEMLGTLGDEETARQLILRLFDKRLIVSIDGQPEEGVRSQVVMTLGMLYDVGMMNPKSLQGLEDGLEELFGSGDVGRETLVSCCRVVHQLGSRAKKDLKEKTIKVLEKEIIPYPDRFIVLGNFGRDICVRRKEKELERDTIVDVFVSDELVTLLCNPQKLASVQDMSQDTILMQRSKEAGDALVHLYNTQIDANTESPAHMNHWKEIDEQLRKSLLDLTTDTRYLLNISHVLKQIRHTPEQCYDLARHLLNPKLPQERLDCLFDTVWEISRRMGYKIFLDGEDLKIVEIDNIERFISEYNEK